MFETKDYKINLNILPEHLDENITTRIKKKVSLLVINKQIKSLGIITKILKIKSISEGIIQHNTGNVQFNVLINVLIYIPTLDEKLKVKILSVTPHGFVVQDGPIDIFVTKDPKNNKENDKNIGDKLTIKITKISFNNGKFIVIAK